MPLQPTQEPPYYEIIAGPSGLGTLQYIALLNQTTTNAPIATELINTIGNIIWTRASAGVYNATLNGAFTTNKTTVITTSTGAALQSARVLTAPDTIQITTHVLDGTQTDNLLTNTTIQITVYP